MFCSFFMLFGILFGFVNFVPRLFLLFLLFSCFSTNVEDELYSIDGHSPSEVKHKQIESDGAEEYESYSGFRDQKLPLVTDKSEDYEVYYNINKEKYASRKKIDLKIAVIMPFNGQKSSDISREILSGIMLSMFDIKNENIKIMPIESGSTTIDVKKATTNAIKSGAKVIIGPVSHAVSRVIAEEVSKFEDVLFISLSNSKSLVKYKNTIVFSFIPDDQIKGIIRYSKSSSIPNISLLLPNSKLGGDLSLLFSKLAEASPESVKISKMEFFIDNSSEEPLIIGDDSSDEYQSESQQVGIEAAAQTANQKTAEQNLSSQVKTNIYYYLKRILYTHKTYIDKINDEIALANKGRVMKRSGKEKDNPLASMSVERLELEKRAILFFTGTKQEKQKIISHLNSFRKMKFYSPVFDNLTVLTDSSSEEEVLNGSMKPDFDFYFGSTSYKDYVLFRTYFRSKFDLYPTRISSLSYDLVSVLNFIYQKNAKEYNASDVISSVTDKDFYGVNGLFTIHDRVVYRNYKIVKIGVDGSIFEL